MIYYSDRLLLGVCFAMLCIILEKPDSDGKLPDGMQNRADGKCEGI